MRGGFEEIGAQGSLAYGSTREALRQIHATEGLHGLFKGASMLWVKGPMTVGLAFVVNDTMKEIIMGRKPTYEHDQYAPLPGRGHHVALREDGVKLQAIESLVCGGIAGATAKTVIAPGDRIKIIFQTDATRIFTWRNVYQTGSRIVGEQGLTGLWRGHGATLLRVVPYSATSYTVFDPYKVWLRKALPGAGDVGVRFLAGAAAGATATTLTYPLDLLRARMAAQRGAAAAYDGYVSAVAHLLREEGFLALWSGLRPTLLGIVPYSGISFSTYETLKVHLRQSQGLQSDKDLSAVQRLGVGAVAGLVAQSITYPIDIVRRRMQVSPAEYPSIMSTVRAVLSKEGVPGLFKGLSMNWVKGPLAMSVSFGVNDFLRNEASRHH